MLVANIQYYAEPKENWHTPQVVIALNHQIRFKRIVDRYPGNLLNIVSCLFCLLRRDAQKKATII